MYSLPSGGLGYLARRIAYSCACRWNLRGGVAPTTVDRVEELWSRSTSTSPTDGSKAARKPPDRGPEAQHAGPPSALLAREFSRYGDIGDKRIASISVDVLSPVPISPLEVSVRVDKPGRQVELLSGEIRAGDKVVLAARAWRVLKAPDDVPYIGPNAKLPESISQSDGDGVGREVMPGAYTRGYLSAVEWLQAPDEEKPPNEPRSARIRPLIPLVEGEPITGTELAMLTADSGSGVHVPIDPFHHAGIN